MSQFFSVSFERDLVKVSKPKDCACQLKGTTFRVDKNNEIEIFEEDFEYGYVVLMKTFNKNVELVDYSQKLSDCYCQFFKEEKNYWVIDGEYQIIKIIYKVDLNVGIVSIL